MRKTFRFLVPGVLSLALVAATAIAQEEASAPLQRPVSVQLPPFNSIEVPKGGHVNVRRGPAQRVMLVRGSLDHSRFTVEGGRLVVEKCITKCPSGYRLEIEIVVPALTRISLANGGSIQSFGSFPRQSDLTVAVAHGGRIDVRSMVVDRVSASVEHGGGIMTAPQAELSARVTQGGVITYWGNARVRSSVEHGGVVQRGDAR